MVRAASCVRVCVARLGLLVAVVLMTGLVCV